MRNKRDEWFLSWHQGDDAEDFRKLEEMIRNISHNNDIDDYLPTWDEVFYGEIDWDDH